MNEDTARERFDVIAAAYRDRSGIERRHTGGDEALLVNAEVFAVLAGNRLTVRLPGDAGTASSAPEWVSIEDGPQWRDLADAAYRQVATSTGITRQPDAVVVDPREVAELVADAFDVGRPGGPMTPVRHVSQETWRLDAAQGSFLVKRFWRGSDVPWRVTLEAAMEFEALALRAGVDSPTPVAPRRPQFAAAASIDGLGVFRAYPYLEHRPLEPDDDITDWYASTLARIQQLEPPLTETPAPTWWYNQFPVVPPRQWERWVEQGRALGRGWAEALAARIDLFLDLSTRVTDAFDDGAPYVMTHRDFETWNILMVPTVRGGSRC